MTTQDLKSATAPRRATIADVSRALGLTKGTVSKALNGYPDISEATRLRVARMAEQMRYNPLSQAQAIRTGRVRAIGFVIENAEHDAHRPFMADFLAGISESASAEGWTLTVAASRSEEGTLETIGRLWEDGRADGFILPRTMVRDPRVEMLRSRGIPFVMFGRTGAPEGCAWYDVSGEAAMRDAVLRLANLGHQRIGFINGGTRYNYSPLRREGYEQGMREAGLDASPALIRENCVERAQGASAARAILEDPEPPTAFVYALDRAALGLYDVAQDLGLSLGGALSVIAYDGIAEGNRMAPKLSTYAVDIHRSGARLGALFIRRVRGEPPETLRELENADYLDRGSAAPPSITSKDLAAIVRGANLGTKTTKGRY